MGDVLENRKDFFLDVSVLCLDDWFLFLVYLPPRSF